jgi:hypothetical protein
MDLPHTDPIDNETRHLNDVKCGKSIDAVLDFILIIDNTFS